MKVYNFFRCPYFEKCTNRILKYYDDAKDFEIPASKCRAPFFVDSSGNAICALSIPENELSEYPERFKSVHKVHKPK